MRELCTLYPRKEVDLHKADLQRRSRLLSDGGFWRRLSAWSATTCPNETYRTCANHIPISFHDLGYHSQLNLHLVGYSRKSTSGAGIVDTPALQIRSDPTHGHRKSRHDRRTASCILLQICGITILHRSMSHNCMHNPKLQVSYYQIYLNYPIPTTDT
jgi:hypothetical protein